MLAPFRAPRPVVALAAVLLGGLAVAWSALSASQTTPPQFRATVDLVAVDFIAVNAGGQPIGDLQQPELTLTVDGRRRDIRTLQFVRIAAPELAAASTPASGAAPTAAAAPKPTPPPFTTNAITDTGRTVYLYFDDNTVSAGDDKLVKQAAARFIDGLTPRDRIAFVTRARTEVELTTDHARVKAALAGASGHVATSISTGGAPLAGLRTFLGSIAVIDGPKTVVLISGGWVDSGRTPSATEYRDVGRDAGRARAHFYVIQIQSHGFGPRASQTCADLGTCSDAPVGPDNPNSAYVTAGDAATEVLGTIASATGGEFYRPSASADKIFDAISQQSSGYYMLGFSPDLSERDGKSHKIEVNVRRPGVTILGRPEFTIGKPADRPATAADLLKDPATHRDVPLRAAAFAAHPAPKGGIDVAIVVDSPDPSVELKEVAFGLIDQGKSGRAWNWSAVPGAIRAGVVRTGITAPAAGSYILRVVAVSSDGRRGTVDLDVAARTTLAGSLSVGDLMLGQGLADGGFEPLLVFSERASATGYFEFTGTLPAGSAVSAAFELARTPDGPALLTVAGIVEPTPTSGRWNARGALPIGPLPPGDYVVRGRLKIDGELSATVAGTLRKQ